MLAVVPMALLIVLGCLCLFALALLAANASFRRVNKQNLTTPLPLFRARAGLLVLLVALTGCGASVPSVGAPPLASAPATSSTALTPQATTNQDWTSYHRDNARTGYVANQADPQHLKQLWDTKLDGEVYAEPLVVGNSVLVATENDSLYALDAGSGRVLWRRHVGSPVPLSSLPCGNIDPLGITGTPVYDPATHLIFAVAEVTGPAHVLVGVDVRTGQVRLSRQIDLAGQEPSVQQQRSALALSHGMVYIAYGGLDGDCGNYHGQVVASRTDGRGPLLAYQVPTSRQGGIWAPSGPAVDTAGRLFVAVGNGAATSGAWDHTDAVLRLSPSLQLEDGFAPDQWQQDNANDDDLGSMGPVLVPGGWVYADGKSGGGYLLHANALGGVGGQAVVKDVCAAYGGAASVGTVLLVPCTNGIQQVLVGPGARLTLGWHGPSQASRSPIVIGHTVYSLDDGGTLYALDLARGTVRTSVFVGAIPHFATPSFSAGRLFVGTLSGVVAVGAA